MQVRCAAGKLFCTINNNTFTLNNNIIHSEYSGHLGWQFSAVGASAGPAVFWGLRRSRLANSPLFEEQQVNQPWL